MKKIIENFAKTVCSVHCAPREPCMLTQLRRVCGETWKIYQNVFFAGRCVERRSGERCTQRYTMRWYMREHRARDYIFEHKKSRIINEIFLFSTDPRRATHGAPHTNLFYCLFPYLCSICLDINYFFKWSKMSCRAAYRFHSNWPPNWEHSSFNVSTNRKSHN